MKRYIATILCLLAFTTAYAGDEAVYGYNKIYRK